MQSTESLNKQLLNELLTQPQPQPTTQADENEGSDAMAGFSTAPCSSGRRVVPNVFPVIQNAPYRLAIIGEAPGETEEREGLPFVGKSGFLLWNLMAKQGIIRDACFIGNICQHRPPNNLISNFKWSGPEIQEGLKQLNLDLERFNPNLCLLLGNTPLRAFGFVGEGGGISNWRGSLLLEALHQWKCLPSIHPASILRTYKDKALLEFDLKRAKVEALTPTLTLLQRDIQVALTPDQIIERLHSIRQQKTPIALDIEGYWHQISCIGIAESPTRCFVIPFDAHWDVPTEKLLLREVATMLSDPTVPKVLQNGIYDLFCLQYGYNIPVRGMIDDIMLAHWELFCELRKRLSFQASIYTREPYWKDERSNISRPIRLVYCGKDCCVTYECCEVIHKQLTPPSNKHYRFNFSVLEPLLYIQLKGLAYDSKKAQARLTDVTHQINRLQWALNYCAGYNTPLSPTSHLEWVTRCRDTLCAKKNAAKVLLVSDIVPYANNSKMDLAMRAVTILQHPTLSKSDLGELSILTNCELNVDSKIDLPNFLYRQLKLPVQYKKEKGRLTDKETVGVLALLTLYKKTSDPTLKLILKIRSLKTRTETLSCAIDPDGRIRCAFNQLKEGKDDTGEGGMTSTGRLSCSKSLTGSGYNLQTTTKKDRELFLADEGYWLFQCDLAGADGWTVAAHCLSCGDPTMYEDYMFGLKPAKILALISMFGREVLSWSRDKLKLESLQVNTKDWMYYARKRIQHGSNYGMKETTMSAQILQDSYKLFGEPVYVSPAVCAAEQYFYNLRYQGLAKWQARIKQQIKTHGYLISASGHRRTFFGRRDDYDTYKEALAEEPQHNTTHATNMALVKLWTDPENRVDTYINAGHQPPNSASSLRRHTELRIQPLHQVHDALIGQFRKEDTEWAKVKIRAYFRNVLVIAGVEITIPFEGNYGRSWGELEEGTI